MLVLSRKLGERIRIGDDVELVVRRIVGNRVLLGVEAPRTMTVLRGELQRRDAGDRGGPRPGREAA